MKIPKNIADALFEVLRLSDEISKTLAGMIRRASKPLERVGEREPTAGVGIQSEDRASTRIL